MTRPSVVPQWFLSLYRRPAAFLLTLAVIPLLVVCGWLYAANERQWRAREGEDLLVAARLASRIVQDELARVRETEEAVAARPAFAEAVRRGDRADLKTSLELLLAATPLIDRATVLDAKGHVLAEASTNNPPGITESSTPSRPAESDRRGGLSWDHPVSGVYLRDQASGEKVVGVSSPIRDGERVLGLLQAQYRLEELSRWMAKLRIEPAGFVYVTDHRGHLVAYPFQLLPGAPKDVSSWAPVSVPLSAGSHLIRFQHGRRQVRAWTAAIVEIEPFGWRVIAQQPDAAMLKPFRRLVWSFAFLIGFIACLLSWLILRWASLHQATLRLLGQQAKLLKLSQQRQTRALMRRGRRGHPGAGDAP